MLFIKITGSQLLSKKRLNQKKTPTPKTRGDKTLTDNEVLKLRNHIVSRVSSYFAIGGPQINRNLNII